MKIYNGYERLPRNYALMSDEYEFTMSNGYLSNNKEKEEAVFDLFFRKIPNDGGYAIMAGLDKVIPYIENLKFTEKELDYFRRNGYSEEFIDYLKNILPIEKITIEVANFDIQKMKDDLISGIDYQNGGLMSIFWTQKVKLFYAALLANNSHCSGVM